MLKSIFPGWWQVLVALLVQAASVAGVFTAFSIVAVPLQETFESSRTLVMLAITVTVLVTGLVNPIIGSAMDRYSLRSLMLIGAVLLGAGFFTLSFAAEITHAVIIYAVFMATASVLLGPLAASTLLARWFTRRRGLAMGIAACGSALGGVLIPPLLQGLIDTYEWRPALRIFSGLLFFCTAPAILFLTINRPSDRNLQPDGDTVAPTVATHRPAAALTTMELLRNANFWFISAIIGLCFCGMTALTAHLVPLVIDRGITAEKGAVLLSLFSAGSLGGKMLFASIADRLELRLTLIVALTLQIISMFGFLHAVEYTFLAMAATLLGLAVGCILPLWGFLLAKAFGVESLGRAMGLMSSVVTLLNLSTPMLFGLVFDRTGSYDPALTVYIGLLFVAVLLAPRVRTSPTPLAAA